MAPMLNNHNNKVMLRTLLNKIFKIDEFAAILGRNVKNNLRDVKVDYKKVTKVIDSCECEEHLVVANRLITLFYIKHGVDYLLTSLENRLTYMKKIIKE